MLFACLWLLTEVCCVSLISGPLAVKHWSMALPDQYIDDPLSLKCLGGMEGSGGGILLLVVVAE